MKKKIKHTYLYNILIKEIKSCDRVTIKYFKQQKKNYIHSYEFALYS